MSHLHRQLAAQAALEGVSAEEVPAFLASKPVAVVATVPAKKAAKKKSKKKAARRG
jgi:ribosomal protein L12E/L44/L45/RPP1/RPP2